MKLRFALSLGAVAVAVVAASCSKEDRNFGLPLDSGGTAGTGGSVSQAGETGEGGSGGDATGVVTAKITAKGDLVGFAATLDGTDSTGDIETYAWAILNAPSGSDITTADLTGADTASASFFPDVGGDYEVELTVTGAGDLTDTVTAMVTATTVDVPYLDISVTMSGSTRVPAAIKSDGTGRVELACFFTDTGTGPADFFRGYVGNGPYGQFGVAPFHPPDSMGVAKLGWMRSEAQAGILQLATTETSCDGDMPFETAAARHPRFSPNGERVAFVTDTGAIATVGADGSQVRIVRPAAVGMVPASLGPPPPFWIDDQTIGWLEFQDGSGDQVLYAAPDETDGFLNQIDLVTYFDCGNVGAANAFNNISQVGVSSAGLIITAQFAANGPPEIFLLRPVNTNAYSCQKNSANNDRLAPMLANSLDFAISPDGEQVAFIHRLDDTTYNTELYVVPADASDMPTKIAGEGMESHNGPHWVAGGRQLVWSQTVPNNAGNAPDESTLMIVNADGMRPRRLVHVESSVTTSRAVSSGANGCSFSPTSTGKGGVLALSGLLLMLALRRKNGKGQSSCV